MSIDMYLGSSDSQAQSVSQVLQNRVTAYGSLQTALTQFSFASPSLSGHTYDSAKAYSQQVLTPLLRGCILLDEAIKEACLQLPARYRQQVDSIDLKESELVEKIYRADRLIGRYQELIQIEHHRDSPDYGHIYRLQQGEANQQQLKMRLEEKLRKLREFNTASSQLFANISALADAVNAGLRQAKTAWNAESQTFTIPPTSELGWVSAIQKEWGKYDFEDGMSDFKKGITNISDWSKEAVGSFFEKTASKVFKEGKNIGKSWAAKLQPKSSLGTFVKDSLKPRKWVTGKLKGMSSTVSKIIGNTAKWCGRGLVVLGAYQEAKEHYNEHRNIGRAVSYSAVATGVGYVAGTVGASIGGAVAVGLGAATTGLIATFAAPLIGAVVVGALTSVAITALYSNVKPFRKAIDWVGDRINDVGRAFSDSLDEVKGVFSW